MFSDSQGSKGIAFVSHWVMQHFLRDQTMQEVEKQQAVYTGEKMVTNVLTPAQETARDKGQAFKPDLERAEQYARRSLEDGVGRRLKGAFACYKAGMQLECLRHILIALDVICCALEWDKASAYLNEQNRLLIKMHTEKEEAA